MVNLARHEEQFWTSLNASTLKDNGPDVDVGKLGHAWHSGLLESDRRLQEVGLPTHSICPLTELIAESLIEKAEGLYPRLHLGMSYLPGRTDSISSLGRHGPYDFMADIDVSGGSMLPLFDEDDTSGMPEARVVSAESLRSTQTAQNADVKEMQMDNMTPPDELQSNQHSSGSGSPGKPTQAEQQPISDSKSDGDAPLRRGLRPRAPPKHYREMIQQDSDDEWAPKRKGTVGGVRDGGRKRPGREKASPGNGGRRAGDELDEMLLVGSDRVERPLPANLDEKQRRRVLRNRASAERSRLKRLGQIAMLEQENNNLRTQLNSRNNSGGYLIKQEEDSGDSKLAHENAALKAELELLHNRVHTLTNLLSASREQS